MSHCLQTFPCKNIPLNLFTIGLWLKWSVFHWADRRRTVNRVSPPQAGCALTLSYSLCGILFDHFPSYLRFPLLMAWLLPHCCPTTSLIPNINSYITDLSQGSQVTGSSSCRRGKYQQLSLPDVKFIFCLSLSLMASCEEYPKPKTNHWGQSWCPLSALGLRELLFCPVLEIYQNMSAWWIIDG